MSMIAFR